MAEEIVAPWVPDEYTLVVFRIQKSFDGETHKCFAAGIISVTSLEYIQKKKNDSWFDADEEIKRKVVTYVFLRGKTIPGSMGVTDRIKWYLHSPELLSDWVVMDGFRRLQKEFQNHRERLVKEEEDKVLSEEKIRKYVGVYQVVKPYQMELEK